MADKRWIGNALPVADVWTLTLGGTWETGDLIKFTVNGKDYQFAAGSTSIPTILATVVTNWNALDEELYPEFAEYTAAVPSGSTTTVAFTHETEGVPGTIAVTTTESDGGAADAQTASIANSTAATGPNFWDNVDNWAEGATPVDTNDVYIENSDVDILYGMAQTAVTLNSLNIHSTYTGKIGLPRRNDGGYQEYRATYLAIKATTVNIGQGNDEGSGRIKIDLSSAQTTVTIFGSGSTAEEGVPSILLKGTHADNALTITAGSVGLAFFAGETATWKTNKIGYETSQETDANVTFGVGCTLGAANSTFVQSGGRVEINSTVLTLTRLGGEMIINAAAAATTIYNRGGRLVDESTGTFAAIYNAAVYDRTRCLKTKTITDSTWYRGSSMLDPNGTITWTNAPNLHECDVPDLKELRIGKHRKITIANI